MRLGADRLVPKTFDVVVDDQESQGPLLQASFAVLDGVPQCRELLIQSVKGGREVRGIDFRRLSVENLFEQALVDIATPYRGAAGEGSTRGGAPGKEDVQETVRQVRVVRRESRRTVNDDLLKQVAEVYRANVKDSPTRAVAAHFGKAHRTGALYVKQAREVGLLREAIKGRAGEK